MNLVAFHNDIGIKSKYLTRLAAHRAADELVHGIGWANGKGCAVGCTLEAYHHERYETELGIPQMLAHLEDCIFEGMSNGKAQLWPERFLSSVAVGSDLTLVGWKFMHWLFGETQQYADDATRKACAPVGLILAEKAIGNEVTQSAAWSAESAAESASAARSASAAKSAAKSAAWSAESAAKSAAWSAASAAWSAAESAESAAKSASAASAAYEKMSDKLIELIEAAPIKS